MFYPEAVPAQVPGAPVAPGGSDVVDWITASTRVDRTIVSAIPPLYGRYATVVIPDDDGAKTRSDRALVEVLQAHTADQPWWLGYPETGVADLVGAAAPRVSLYVGWTYILLTGGPRQALAS